MRKILTVFLAAWFGAYLLAGYGVAPLLFQNLPKMQAGMLAGVLFDAVNYAGMIVALSVHLATRRCDGYGQMPAGRNLSLILLCLLSFSQLMITPVIKALRAGQTHWLSDIIGGSFSVWHGVSSTIYLLASVLALALVARVLQFGGRTM